MIIPTACHSWEFGQGNGKRLLSKQEITEEVSGLNLCYHSSGLGLEDRRRFFKEKNPNKHVFENRTLGIKQLIPLHNHYCSVLLTAATAS